MQEYTTKVYDKMLCDVHKFQNYLVEVKSRNVFDDLLFRVLVRMRTSPGEFV